MVSCEFARIEGSDGKLGRKDAEPFHCSCPIRHHPFASPVTLSQWGKALSEEHVSESCAKDAEFMSAKRRERGSANFERIRLVEYLTPLYTTDGATHKELLQRCPSNKDHWCWTKDMTLAERPVLDAATNCGALGSNVARTMSMTSTIIAKLLLIVAIGSEQPLIFCFTQNLKVTTAVCVSFCLMLLMVYVPGLPQMNPLPFPALLTCFSFALIAHAILDIFKVFYRMEFRRSSELKQYHAKAISAGLLSPQASEDEIRAFQISHPGLVPELPRPS